MSVSNPFQFTSKSWICGNLQLGCKLPRGVISLSNPVSYSHNLRYEYCNCSRKALEKEHMRRELAYWWKDQETECSQNVGGGGGPRLVLIEMTPKYI
jgi:hypothetical protein